MAARVAAGGGSSTVLLEEPAATTAVLSGGEDVIGPGGLGRTLRTCTHPVAPGLDNNAPVGSPGAALPDPNPPPDATSVVQKHRATATALTLLSLSLSTVLSSLDTTIVAAALPAIVADFKSSTGYIWVGSAFILSYTAITPIWGSVADIWGRKPIILLAVTIFLVGSLLCALAPTIDAMIAGRAVQGLGASGMGVMVNIIISDMFSLRDRGLYLAMMSMIWAVGSSVGPLLGGIMTTKLTWRWCFWINLPIGVVAMIALLVFLRVPNPHTPVVAGLKAIDWVGSMLVIGSALMVLLGFDFGDVVYPWSSPTVISLVVVGFALIGGFIFNEWKLTRNPIMPLRLFKTVSTSAAFGVYSLNFYVFIGLTYYLPLYSQSVLGADALMSGVYMLPLIVSCSLAAAFGGVLIQQTGKYLSIMYIAQVMLTLGAGLFINLEFEKNLTKLILFEIITGIGVGLNMEAPTIAALAGAAERDTAATIAAMTFIRSLATAVSVVIGGVIFQNEMAAAGPSLVARLGDELAGQFSGGQAAANVELISAIPGDQQIVVRRAYFDGMKKVWIMYVAFAGLASVLNLFVRAHHLRREREAVVLGVDRHSEPLAEQTASEPGLESMELRSRRRPERSSM